MIGAIIGDIVGSRFEFTEDDGRDKNFVFWGAGCQPTDDTFMTLAVANALVLANGDAEKLKSTAVSSMREVGRRHSDTSWGERFYRWLFTENPKPYNSCGNGAGMRVSPVGWVAESEEEVKVLSRAVTEVTHNHPEGIKGAEAVAMAVYLARTGKSKAEIKGAMQEYYPQLKDENFTIKNIYGNYGYDERGDWVTCQGSIPQALAAFFDSESFEDAIRNAVYIGGDSDTIGAMAGSVAEAYYGVPSEIEERALSYLSDDLKDIYREVEAIRKPRTPRKNV